MAAHEYKPTLRKATRSHLRMQSTSSTRHEMWHCYVAPSTNKLCDATTSATCTLVSSTSQGSTQARTTLGGAVHRPPGAPTQNIQDPIRGRMSRLQCVEHRTPMAILSMSNCSNLIHR
jgi:hypothetical protein